VRPSPAATAATPHLATTVKDIDHMKPEDIKLNRTQRRAIMRANARAIARIRHAQYRKAQRLGVSRDVMLAADAARKAARLAAEAAAPTATA
jgi:hypothetical protein